MSMRYKYEYEYSLDFPSNVLIKGRLEFIDGHIIVSRYEEEDFMPKFSIISLETGIKTGEYLILTHPIDGYLFAANFCQEKSSDFDIYLLDLNGRIHTPLLAARQDEFKFYDALEKGMYKITVQGNCNGLKSISVPNPKIFEEDFAKLISEELAVNNTANDSERYWIGDSDFFGSEDFCINNYGNDCGGDMEDTWDAITGGNYDDMPEGWDGDMEFMGH